jgi:hypothetical protein
LRNFDTWITVTIVLAAILSLAIRGMKVGGDRITSATVLCLVVVAAERN